MKLFSELKRAAGLLANFPSQWAICGGVAASIYRQKTRFTDDIDFALIDSPQIKAEELASKIIKDLGFKEYKGFVPDPRDNRQQIFALLCARGAEDQRFVGLV